MNAYLNAIFFEKLFYWGTIFVGTIAAIWTIFGKSSKEDKQYVLFNVLNFVLSFIVLHYVIKEFRPSLQFLNKIQSNWVPFSGFYLLIYLIFADFLFYLNHRFVHQVPLFWVGHFAHHSGSKLHLSLIIRENFLSNIISLPFNLLGIPLGLNPFGVFVCVKFILFYQSFLHYYTDKDIPFIKYVFVTPYNHIIHHSTEYDGAGQNFGGVFSIWDRLCGTYHDEKRFLRGFGVPGSKNQNTFWAVNVSPLVNLLNQCVREKSVVPLFMNATQRFSIKDNLWTTVAYSVSIILFFKIIWDWNNFDVKSL